MLGIAIYGYLQPNLTGHSKSNSEALQESTDVVVANFTTLGYRGSEAIGQDDYDRAEINVTGALKGSLSGKLSVFFTVFVAPRKHQEHLPVLGSEYILFIQKLGPKEYDIKKILPSTPFLVSKIKALISSEKVARQ
jgi:hypothetical protein